MSWAGLGWAAHAVLRALPPPSPPRGPPLHASAAIALLPALSRLATTLSPPLLPSLRHADACGRTPRLSWHQRPCGASLPCPTCCAPAPLQQLRRVGSSPSSRPALSAAPAPPAAAEKVEKGGEQFIKEEGRAEQQRLEEQRLEEHVALAHATLMK